MITEKNTGMMTKFIFCLAYLFIHQHTPTWCHNCAFSPPVVVRDDFVVEFYIFLPRSKYYGRVDIEKKLSPLFLIDFLSMS